MVAIDPKTGQILVMVGSKDYFGASYPEGCVITSYSIHYTKLYDFLTRQTMLPLTRETTGPLIREN